MQKETLYDVLEVSEKASSEVIEKAYKVREFDTSHKLLKALFIGIMYFF